MSKVKLNHPLEKYVGTYRVIAEYDTITHDFPKDKNGKIDSTFEDWYISCGKGKIKHTSDDSRLVLFFEEKARTAKNLFDKMRKENPNLNLEYDDQGIDAYIYFNSKDIKKIDKYVHIRTAGKSIKPYSKKNLPVEKIKISDSAIEELREASAAIPKNLKMAVMKKVNKAFLEEISNKKSNHVELQKIENLPIKEYIYKLGKWNDYTLFVKKHAKDYL